MATTNKLLVPTILSVSLLTIMAASAVSPALNSIKEAFPGITDTSVKMIMTLPSLVMIPFSLLSGWFSAKIDKKWLVVIGMVLYLVFGVGGAFVSTFMQLVICRAFFGIAIGILMPLSNTLIFDLVGADQRNKVMGLSVSSNQVGGILFLSLSGFLANISWRYSFLVYLLAVLSLLLVLWKLPLIPPIKKAARQNTGENGSALNWKIFALAFVAMMSSVCLFVVYTDLALYIQQEKKAFSSSIGLVHDKQTLDGLIESGKVNEELIVSFADKRIAISDKASLKEIHPQKEWLIKDGRQEYRIYKENDNLSVMSSLGTSEMAGYALSLMGIPAAIAGFILAFLLKRIGYYLMPLAAVVMAGGYALLGLADTYPMILLAVLFIGLAGGLLSSPMMLLVPKILPARSQALGIAILSSFILLGQFVSPLYTEGVTAIVGNDGFRFKFFVVTVTLLVLAGLGIVYIYLKSRSGLSRNDIP